MATTRGHSPLICWRLMDAEGIESFDMAGHDWGGMAGFLIALEHPDRLRRPPCPQHPAAVHTCRSAGHLGAWRFWYQWAMALPLAGPLAARSVGLRVQPIAGWLGGGEPAWDKETRQVFTAQFRERRAGEGDDGALPQRPASDRPLDSRRVPRRTAQHSDAIDLRHRRQGPRLPPARGHRAFRRRLRGRARRRRRPPDRRRASRADRRAEACGSLPFSADLQGKIRRRSTIRTLGGRPVRIYRASHQTP